MRRTVYFDNAATSYPKPAAVVRAVTDAMRTAGNPGRGSHRLAETAAELVYDCRAAAAEMFGAEPERVVFTAGATHALNAAVKGLAEPGCHILIDNYAHNAALRPVAALASAGFVEYDVYDADGDEERVLANIVQKLRPTTRLLIATHQSNICSHILPVGSIGRLCREYGIHLIVDAAQSAGHLPVDLHSMNITALCIPGHKGLFGPMGVGMLISAPDVTYQTILEGGAGIHSLDAAMPEELPERLEAGTLPLPAIAGLLAGIRYVRQTGLQEICLHECTLTSVLTGRLREISGVTLYGESVGSVVGFNVAGYSPAEVGAHLASRGICVRTGYHCAPLAHRTVGSFENGSVRVSVSHLNRMTEIDRLVNAVRDLQK
ncbi:MAG: aminotransferase class V-fold PLP-dependent enzyme [Clostridia bacterium]|nr:aminotransferase class V-fold PLP-dependent enzyme [Clostridia bacterium]